MKAIIKIFTITLLTYTICGPSYIAADSPNVDQVCPANSSTVLTKKIEQVLDKTDKSIGEVIERIEKSLDNAFNRSIIETRAIFPSPVRETVQTIIAALRIVVDRFAETSTLLSHNWLESVKRPFISAVEMMQLTLINLANSDIASRMNPNESAKSPFAEMVQQLFRDVSNCIPDVIINGNELDSLFDHVDEYVDFIITVPGAALKCLEMPDSGACFHTLSDALFEHTHVMREVIFKDLDEVSVKFENFGEKLKECYRNTTSDLEGKFVEMQNTAGKSNRAMRAV